LSSTERLWYIDALRDLGRADEAVAAERELLAEGRLHPERIAGLLQAIQVASGPKAVLEAVAAIQEDTRHPAIVSILIGAAEEAQNDEALQYWTAASESAEAAKARIAALDNE